MMPSSSNISDKFPAGLRVLVVDDDRVCLTILDLMLKKCNYQVTKCSRAEVALSLLRNNKNGFDVVLSDVHMPDMDGFKLLVHIGLEMDLPVIMMSADDSKSVVMKGVTHGACDYLIKPVRMEALGNIWQHVVRKKKNEWKDIEPKASLDDGDRQQQKQPEDPDYSSSANEGHNCKSTKRRKDNEDEAVERDDSSLKKPRVVWSQELHQQFVTAVSRLGIEKAVPKKILDLMNVPGLTRENVASHLQKFRLYLRRLSESQQSGGINTSLIGNPDAGGYGSISSLGELDRQALAASGQLNQLPAQSMETLQAVALGRSGNLNSPISVPLADQRRNVFSFEDPKLRYEHAQNQHGHTSRQMNLLHGIPTTMEPKQLAGLQRSFTSMNSQGLILMTGQSQSQSQTYNHASRQPIIPNATVSQAPSQLDFTANHRTEFAGNSFPLRGNLGITSLMSTSTLQLEKNLETRIPGEGFVPTYGLSNNVNQNRPHDWGMGLTYDPRQHTNNVQGRFNVLQHIYASGEKTTGIFSAGEGSSIHLADNPSQVKTKNVNCGTSRQQVCPQEYSQDDLYNTILIQQQQQQGIGQPENDILSDWYSLDNLPA